MGEYSKIEWTDHTFNPWIGCTNVSPGCDHCYAETWAKRFYNVKWGNNPRRRTSDALWKNPIKWNNQAKEFASEHGHRPRVFCASLADVFDNQVAVDWRVDLFKLIRQCDELDWLLLTKRPQNVRKMLPADWGAGYANVWLGMTAEDQLHFDKRWKHLRAVPASVKFISYEPALGPLHLPADDDLPDWLISGGESGPGARPVKRRWIRSIISDCHKRGVAVFHKQWGSYASNPLVGKNGWTVEQAKAADSFGKGGGLIDGRLVREFPFVKKRR